ncbi:MAG: sulfite exporter TauE/SafE family protein, partial [Rhodospirillales bacterium]|nr:sulfite exporter TauE/SafE family protein [Rhodospirillales bacterium]
FGFGLGTLPMLLVMGGAAGHLKTVMQHGMIRQVAGVLVICFGIYSGYAAGTGSHHTHAEKHSSLEIALSLVFG